MSRPPRRSFAFFRHVDSPSRISQRRFLPQKVLCGRLKHVLQVGHFTKNDDGDVKMLVKLYSKTGSSPENDIVIEDRLFLEEIDQVVQAGYTFIRPQGFSEIHEAFLKVPEHLDLGEAFVKVTVSTTDYELKASAYGEPRHIPGPLHSAGRGLYVQFQLYRQTLGVEQGLMLEPKYRRGVRTRGMMRRQVPLYTRPP